MFSPGRERKVELSLSLTPFLLRPSPQLLAGGRSPSSVPLPRTAWVLWGPECMAGSVPPKTRTLSMWLQLVVDGEHTVRGTEGSRAEGQKPG